MTASAVVAFGAALGGFASDQLVEVALPTACKLVLNQQRQFAFIKFLEPLVPIDVLERLLAGISGEVEADHADVIVAASTAHARGSGIALFRPAANLIVIRENS